MSDLVDIRCGDCLDVLREMPDRSVHCCVTSPPYFGLRDYGVDGQVGLEDTPAEYVAKLVGVFREVRRVLRDDGTLWLNLGDSYASKRVGRLKHKDLVGIPWHVAFSLRADGWYLRQDIIWHKPNPMPESVTDRCTKAHEYVFLLTKSPRYYYDANAIREPIKPTSGKINGAPLRGPHVMKEGARRTEPRSYNVIKGANRRSVWTITTKPFKGAHFATFPPDLVEPCILAGTSERGACPECGAPWVRKMSGMKYKPPVVEAGERNVDDSRGDKTRKLDGKSAAWRDAVASQRTLGFFSSCECGKEPVPATVLDPFGGSGTTGMVAARHGRRSTLIELNPEYVEIMRARIAGGK